MPTPLRRRSDRVEAALVMVAVLGFLFMTCLSVWIGQTTYERDRLNADLSAAALHRVDALVLETPSRAADSGAGQPMIVRPKALARWSTPASGSHTGVVTVSDGSRAGATTRIWVDDQGRAVEGPPTDDQIALKAVGLAAGVTFCSLVGMALVYWTGRWRLDRRRYAEWESEWERVEPTWTHHPPQSDERSGPDNR